MKTILITGGSGFIGRNLAEKLYGKGDRIIILDRVVNQSPGYLNYKLDIRYPIANFVDYSNVDEIYHLACPASPVQYAKDPIDTIDTAIQGTRNVLELARTYQCKIVIASTSEVYGNPLEHPQQEFYNGNVSTMSDRACYREGKRAAETYARLYNTQYGVDARIVRLFNVYGPHMALDDGRVIPEFVKAALLDKDLVVNGGTQTRSFCYVDDIVRGLIAAMESTTINKFVYPRPINLGSKNEMAIIDVANIVTRMIGKGRVCVSQHQNDDPQRRQPDIKRAANILNWKPVVGFEYGLEKTIADIRSRL